MKYKSILTCYQMMLTHIDAAKGSYDAWPGYVKTMKDLCGEWVDLGIINWGDANIWYIATYDLHSVVVGDFRGYVQLHPVADTVKSTNDLAVAEQFKDELEALHPEKKVLITRYTPQIFPRHRP